MNIIKKIDNYLIELDIMKYLDDEKKEKRRISHNKHYIRSTRGPSDRAGEGRRYIERLKKEKPEEYERRMEIAKNKRQAQEAKEKENAKARARYFPTIRPEEFSKNSSKYTEEEDKMIMNKDMSLNQLSKLLKRSQMSIAARRSRLRKQ